MIHLVLPTYTLTICLGFSLVRKTEKKSLALNCAWNFIAETHKSLEKVVGSNLPFGENIHKDVSGDMQSYIVLSLFKGLRKMRFFVT